MLPDGGTLGDCDGHVPALCVIRDGAEVGSLQHSSFPVPTGHAEDDIGGLHGELLTFAPADLDALLPVLDRVMVATALPAG